ncbi:unnamed protein product [Heterobilharzia americana]|nr:unnamed protein product [Heterobilharzia americana]
MPIFNHCPIQAKDYCQNGGECFYLSGDPSVYMCSCFMPFYGPQCEHKAPNRDKQLEVDVQSNDDHDNDGIVIKRSVDRAMTLTALIFIVVTFLAMLILAWYISRRRRKDFARWKRMTELALKSNYTEKVDKETQITPDYLTEKETSSLIKSIHSIDNSSHREDTDSEEARNNHHNNSDNQGMEAQFESPMPTVKLCQHYQKQDDDEHSSQKIYQDVNQQNDEKSSVLENPNTGDLMKLDTPTELCSHVSSSKELPIDSQTKMDHKKRTRSKRKAPSIQISDNELLTNHQAVDKIDERVAIATTGSPGKYANTENETEEADILAKDNSQRKQSINRYNNRLQQLLSHEVDHPTRPPMESQRNPTKSYDHLTSHTIGRNITNPVHTTVNILSSAILDRPYINADEIHTLFDNTIPNASPIGQHQSHDLEYFNPVNTKISSTLPRDYKNHCNTNPVNTNQPSHWLNAEYLTDKRSKIFHGPQEPFIVASQHDALLSELLHRGKESSVTEPRPKSTF